MYRNDKQFMKDPATAHCRIYVGNLAETVTADNLEQKFKEHGKILGLVLQRGFGFIQFETEEQVKAAIQNEHSGMFFGRRMNVKQAFTPKMNNPPAASNQNTQGKQPPQQSPRPLIPPANVEKPQKESEKESLLPPPASVATPQAQVPPPQNQSSKDKKDFQSQDHKRPDFQGQDHKKPDFQGQDHKRPDFQGQDHKRPDFQGHDHKRPDFQGQDHKRPDFQSQDHKRQDFQNQDHKRQDFQGQDHKRQDFQSQDHKRQDFQNQDVQKFSGGPPQRGRKRPMRGGIRDRELDRHGLPMDNYRGAAPYYGRDEPYAPGFVPPAIVDAAPERNDCEIIVVSKALTEYAEYIEQRLKSLGLIVDLLFPNEDVPIGRVLANISSRGCLYAILVMPQNEEHRSLTLDILHGIPQEHRNMPTEDALVLITRNFDAYMRGEKAGQNPLGTGVNALSDRHPEAVQMLFNLLAENRQITTAQYDRIIKYLLERRDLQTQHESTEGGDPSSEDPPNKQVELQSRIMNILNKTNEDPPKPAVTPAPAAVGPTPLLNDPSVQKALDSLLLGDMFKNISGGL